ncbi:UDP-N-acetylglucosamine 2-epimerase (non-hydrolyzing) [Iamia sp. SCSIO 61187]|uniref:non-hydrolyzing UDP-N-acetylglucosamine 2-epimerase n=1 Tax=Iamia sp. SCSIO 61187 TaxID=2722752 RepID=UPI001C638D2E|nr:UDP-N-acetylglucosamine 2-epimerase (non-hydrolyzing) [Iamia sp. SCSIO 61187]QYG92354.1 UDP-N-acetylglucosamine 2-epimerase (non-hydrolyzing) [Iamia sp. SCSIO 61187]
MKVCVVAGARPNFMKLAPVVKALEGRGAEVVIVHSGQHYDPMMSDIFFEELALRVPDHHLGVGSGSHAVQTGSVMVAFEPLLHELKTDTVVVVGDVNSTVACALVAAKAGVEVAHVEAGLRSRDWSMPEEINRVVVDRLADTLLAPSPDGVENLLAEGCPAERIHLVGNVMIDTLLTHLDQARSRPIRDQLDIEDGEYGLVTLHRPANVDDPSVLAGIARALVAISESCRLIFPAHPRVAGRLAEMDLGPRVTVIGPIGYMDSIALQSGARLVLTDSGGIQEETTVLGVPCLTLRDNTERPITISEGTNLLVGRDPERIITSAELVLAEGVERRRPALWDGRAAERIADALLGS